MWKETWRQHTKDPPSDSEPRTIVFGGQSVYLAYITQILNIIRVLTFQSESKQCITIIGI